jgi:hypothetical protein
MKLRVLVPLVIATLSSVPVFAQPPKQPVTNTDFQAMAAQVAMLTSQVTALGNTVGSLVNQAVELNQRLDALNSVTPLDLVGTYRLFSLGIEMHGNPARIGNEVADATITFRADGTGTVNWTDYRADLSEGTPWFMTHGLDPFVGEFGWTRRRTGSPGWVPQRP